MISSLPSDIWRDKFLATVKNRIVLFEEQWKLISLYTIVLFLPRKIKIGNFCHANYWTKSNGFTLRQKTPKTTRKLQKLPIISIFVWSIFLYNGYFWQWWALKWICFPISIHYNISKTGIFGAPSSTPVGDKHMLPLTFLYEIESWTTFIWSFFSYNAYLWQRWALKWICFPISIHYNISKMAVFVVP